MAFPMVVIFTSQVTAQGTECWLELTSHDRLLLRSEVVVFFEVGMCYIRRNHYKNHKRLMIAS